MTLKAQLRAMQDKIREMMTELDEIGEETEIETNEANINDLYESMRTLRLKLGETARTWK